ncbi:MAG: cell division protein FtsX [Paenibacillus sp.]|nr:cell division protein FtsX [Paenibacillus sp.]
MNIVNKLTIRHLKQNKRRTLVTVIGVIISVAMLTAVATISVSFMELLQRQTIADEGEWHVLYKDVNRDQLESIKSDDATKQLVISKDRGYARLEGSQNDNKPYLFVKAYNHQGFEQFPIELSEGRLPKTAHEVVISEAIATNAKVVYNVGDLLTLNVGERVSAEGEGSGKAFQQQDALQTEDGKISESLLNLTVEKYTIVGKIKRPTWEPTWAPGYTIISYLDESLIEADETVHASVVLKKVNRSLYTHAEELAERNKIASVQFNSNLLRYYGVTNDDNLSTTLYSLAAIIMTVIIVGSVSLIYNAFAISVSERTRHLGMLSSVGATKRQKRNSVFFEGAIIGLISIPLGIIGGLVGISITFWFINEMFQDALGTTEKLRVSVTPFSIVIACTVSAVTIFISTYLPAIKASKISAIDAIRQTNDVKLTGKAVKTSKLIRKLFGFEAEIGLKNLKRNKRRYQATVFSLVISIVLFLSVSFFTSSLKKSVELTQASVNYDIQAYLPKDGGATNDQLIKSIANLQDVTEYSVKKRTAVYAWINEAAIPDEVKEMVKADKSILKDGKLSYFILMHALDDKSIQAYAKEVSANYDQLIDPTKPSAIIIDTISYQDDKTRKFVEAKTILMETGQILNIHQYEDADPKEENNIHKVEVAAKTAQFPVGVTYPVGMGNLDIVVSEQVFDQLIEDMAKPDIRTEVFLKSTDPLKTQQEIEEWKEGIGIYNVFKNRQQDEQMIMFMSVFTYGFIALITAISIANIFNTIATGISLRKREFAMLKSIGMTPKGFNKMLNYESAFYGIKSLLYGLPISIVVMYLIHKSLANSFSYAFKLPMTSIMFVIVAVFAIVGSAMLYSSSKVKKENIIDVLKQESI